MQKSSRSFSSNISDEAGISDKYPITEWSQEFTIVSRCKEEM